MTLHAQIEAAQPVARQAVAAALQHNRLGPVPLHDAADDGLEDVLVGPVVDAVAQGEVDGVVFAVADADVAQLARAGEVLAVFMEGAGHDPVGGIEGFLDAVAVVDVDVDVQDALLEAEELDDTEYNICQSRNANQWHSE